MFSLSSSHRFYLYKQPCDMRKGFQGLSGLVTGKMEKDPISGDVFIFINRRATHIKLLHWESGGFVIYYKRLEKGTFSLPKVLESGTVSWSQLVMMIEGIKAEKLRHLSRYNPPSPIDFIDKNTK
ncbi:IS66 family insertion sequence element accessory protein TnpB [Arenibacter latericius]|uniref:IS66 family insertion sequence element accessory protein TnpB n=1 Tax=Arenibacter latericius TaxID=86104 RepID=UPI000686F947|nr:IS66 family insertion sequence element accessory protein TnpB [Arenibacter latericius]